MRTSRSWWERGAAHDRCGMTEGLNRMSQLNPDTGEPLEPTPFRQLYPELKQPRAPNGWWISEGHGQPPGRDEMRTREMCVSGLRKLWHQLPRGGRKPLARELRLAVTTLRSIVKGRGVILEPVRRRISRFLCHYDRGEVSLKRLSPDVEPRELWKAQKPSHRWEYAPGFEPAETRTRWTCVSVDARAESE